MGWPSVGWPSASAHRAACVEAAGKRAGSRPEGLSPHTREHAGRKRFSVNARSFRDVPFCGAPEAPSTSVIFVFAGRLAALGLGEPTPLHSGGNRGSLCLSSGLCPAQPRAGGRGLRLSSPRLCGTSEVEGKPFIFPRFHLMTARPLISSVFLFLLLPNESLGGKERPEVGPEPATAL